MANQWSPSTEVAPNALHLTTSGPGSLSKGEETQSSSQLTMHEAFLHFLKLASKFLVGFIRMDFFKNSLGKLVFKSLDDCK